jgi:hypothetical protein
LNKRGLEFDDFTIAEYVEMAKVINSRITNNRLMGRNMQLGHAMWVPKGAGAISKDDVTSLLQFGIIPQIEAYLGFGNENQLGEMLNANIAAQYLGQKKLDFNDVIALVRDSTNAKEQ